MTDTLPSTLDFDTGAADSDDLEFKPIPDGDYPVNITKAEVKATKTDPNGRRVALTLKVTDGDYRGRTIMTGLNVVNRNDTAQKIGRAQLKQLLEAIGMVGEQDMANIVGCELTARVVVKPPQNGYDASNDVKKFLKLGASGAKKAAPSFMKKGG